MANEYRVTQFMLHATVSMPNFGRVTQFSVDVLRARADARVTQIALHVLRAKAAARVSTVFLHVLRSIDGTSAATDSGSLSIIW